MSPEFTRLIDQQQATFVNHLSCAGFAVALTAFQEYVGSFVDGP